MRSRSVKISVREDGTIKAGDEDLMAFLDYPDRCAIFQNVSDFLFTLRADGEYKPLSINDVAPGDVADGLMRTAAGELRPCEIGVSPNRSGYPQPLTAEVGIYVAPSPDGEQTRVLRSPFSQALIDSLPGLFFVVDDTKRQIIKT